METGEFDKPTLTTSKKCMADFSVGVKEINPYLYIGEKEPGLYHIMERIDTAVPGSRLSFWQDYISRERKNHNEYKKLWAEERLPKGKGFLQFESRECSLIDSIGSFEKSVNQHNSNNELWIAFTSSKSIQDANEITFDDIEIAVPVMTDKDSPMVTPMGLGRSFHYMLKAAESEKHIQNILDLLKRHSKEKLIEFGYSESDLRIPENKFKVHPGQTMDILSFMAKVMKIRDENKTEMIHAPVPAVRNILLKALPDHVYVGDNVGDNKRLAITTHKSIAELPSKAIYVEHAKLEEELAEEIQILKKKHDELCKFRNDSNREEIKDKYFEMKDRLDKQQEEKRKKSKELWDLYSDTKDKEIDDILQKLAAKVEMTPKTSPIRRTGQKIQIFDHTRKNIIFEHDKESKIIFVNNKKLEGDEANRYNWFYHGDMRFQPCVTTDLEALANLKKLMPFEDK